MQTEMKRCEKDVLGWALIREPQWRSLFSSSHLVAVGEESRGISAGPEWMDLWVRDGQLQIRLCDLESVLGSGSIKPREHFVYVDPKYKKFGTTACVISFFEKREEAMAETQSLLIIDQETRTTRSYP